MSGVSRFLSRREKKQPPHTQVEKKPDHFGGLFTAHDDPKKKPDKDEDKKVKAILDRLRQYGIETMVESNVEYALRASNGNSEAAFSFLMLLQDTYEGIVRPYNPDTRLLGAVNRNSVTCFLDALLFAMFARLDSFEAMLYDGGDDIPRKKLAGLLRLWVNMLRTGRLIGTDVTAYVQTALAECGWRDAANVKQQDPSEAFTFITGQLGLPLLTLKMDLFHTGKEDLQDDHKFINERLLEVAIPEEPPEGSNVITLEDCLEHYFNNRIEVKRHLENRRRNTLESIHSVESGPRVEKEPGMHIEVVELDRPDTPIVQSPIAETPTQGKSPVDKLRPTAGRKRGDSIFSQRKIELTGIEPQKLEVLADSDAMQDAKGRKLSHTRTEVLMPAWQFFKLLPWYTDHLPTSDAQVAAHFSRKRPVLGICLKRYSYTMTGQATRRNTYVDIPLEIGVPNFVSDDSMQDDGPLVGNFRLMLQSVVCHRGVSVHSGHYITLCRGRASNAQHGGSENERRGSADSDDAEDPWMRFDDLARERVSYVDIHQALKQETPYLLFYQVQPIGDDGHPIHELPSYAEATSRAASDTTPLEKPDIHDHSGSENALSNVTSNAISESPVRSPAAPPKSEATDFATGSERTSLDVNTMPSDGRRGRSSLSIPEERRRSIAFDESSFAGSTSGGSVRTPDHGSNSVPTTPSEEKSGGFLAVANKIGSRRGSRVSRTSMTSRSRPTSTGPDGNGSRFSLNMSKLTQRMSRGDLPAAQQSDAGAAELAAQQDAVSPIDKTSVVSNAVAVPAHESVTTGKPIPKHHHHHRKDKAATKHEKRKSKGQHDDRDCVVM
ncbi:hypothetical protein LTR36_005881 [Oleoguttula mirabilis]|uniref:ubiquitinyl hydrolase 1 n=1 Tax=Oleoguttula mirabilis TaxID=1507867 RepID=A0AAV9JD96_9PEZI|nr:hypothetical protein LTR36_005881 [Oleoguttula mirabilis]